MVRWPPCKHRDFIRKLRLLGFTPPEPGGRHFYMRYGRHTLTIPSNPEFSVPQLKMLLKQVERILGRKISSKVSVMLLLVNLSLANLLDSEVLSDEGVRCLVGWQTLILVDLLQRQCITVRYAERVLFNLDVVQRLKRRRLKDCVEVVDRGMQLEDWEEYTPEHLPEALLTIARLAQHLLEKVGKRKTETPALIKPRRHAGAQPVRD